MDRTEIAESMRRAARRIGAWRDAFAKLHPEYAEVTNRAMTREVLRLKADAILVEGGPANDSTEMGDRKDCA